MHGIGNEPREVHWEGQTVNAAEVEHPVVAVHPETGRKDLFVNPLLTRHIKGLEPVESAALLALLYDRGARLENVIQYRWRRGDLVLWDNRAVRHRRVEDNDPAAPRIVHRVQLRDSAPVGPARTPA